MRKLVSLLFAIEATFHTVVTSSCEEEHSVCSCRLEHHKGLDESPACSSKMPFVKVATTLSRNQVQKLYFFLSFVVQVFIPSKLFQLPKDFMPKLNTFLASLLEKVSAINIVCCVATK